MNEKVPPLIGPKKGINKEIKYCVIIYSDICRVEKLKFLAFPGGFGGFREVREADRNHLHLSWYLLVSVVTSYDQKPWWIFVRSSPEC